MKIIDLSVPIYGDSQVPPSQPRKTIIETVHKEPGFWQASWLSISAHLASHVDSPLHVVENSPTIGEIPLDQVIGEAVVLDFTGKGENEEITDKDLEKYADDIREGDIVILRTDWGEKRFRSPDFSYWHKSPVITPQGARWLVQRRPKAVAFDFFEEYNARLKGFKPDDFVVHKILLGAGIIIIEGLVNLGKLPKRVKRFFACPLRIMVTEAAPARVFAVEED
jgi:arylformamidase